LLVGREAAGRLLLDGAGDGEPVAGVRAERLLRVEGGVAGADQGGEAVVGHPARVAVLGVLAGGERVDVVLQHAEEREGGLVLVLLVVVAGAVEVLPVSGAARGREQGRGAGEHEGSEEGGTPHGCEASARASGESSGTRAGGG